MTGRSAAEGCAGAVKCASLHVAIHGLLFVALMMFFNTVISPFLDDFFGEGHVYGGLQSGLMVTKQSLQVVRLFAAAEQHPLLAGWVIGFLLVVDALIAYAVRRRAGKMWSALWFSFAILIMAIAGGYVYVVLYVQRPIIGIV